MAIMNQLSLNRVESAHQPEDIDTNEVLREFGLEGATNVSTVVQQPDGTTVTIPERADSLTPPPINSPAEAAASNPNIDAELDEFADSLLAATASPEVLNADTGMPPVDSPRDLDAEEDDDWDRLQMEGMIAAAGEPNNPSVADTTTSVANEASTLDTPVSSEEVGETTPAVPEVSETPVAEETPAPTLTAEEAINLLPKNSLSFATDDTTSRFSGAAWYDAIQLSTVLLAGLGGIGSYILFCLSRMKPKQIFIYDDDIVELANLSGQLYSASMVGKRKVDAMAELAKDFSCYYGVQAIPQRFTADTPAADIMICGFDNMQARKDFFDAWVNHLVHHPMPHKCLFIDGRLNMEEFQVFCMKGNDTYNIEKYHREYLFEDHQAESIQCSMKQTTYCANMIGSVIVNLFTNFIANQLKPLIDRDLPFKTYYDASMMYFKTEV